MPQYKNNHISGRSLRMPGLQPTDYFLFKETRQYFDFDMRQVVVLGLRLTYAMFHDKALRNMILEIAQQVKMDDLDACQPIRYDTFAEMDGSSRLRP